MSSAHVERILARMVVPDVVVPAQFYTPPAERSPEVKLLGAILDDAFGRLRADTQAGREAMCWFENPTHGKITLEYVCEHLNLDVAAYQQAATLVYAKRLHLPRRNHQAIRQKRIRATA